MRYREPGDWDKALDRYYDWLRDAPPVREKKDPDREPDEPVDDSADWRDVPSGD